MREPTAVAAGRHRAFHISVPIYAAACSCSLRLRCRKRLLSGTFQACSSITVVYPPARPANSHTREGTTLQGSEFLTVCNTYLPTMFLREPRGLPPPSPSFFLSFMLTAGSAQHPVTARTWRSARLVSRGHCSLDREVRRYVREPKKGSSPAHTLQRPAAGCAGLAAPALLPERDGDRDNGGTSARAPPCTHPTADLAPSAAQTSPRCLPSWG